MTDADLRRTTRALLESGRRFPGEIVKRAEWLENPAAYDEGQGPTERDLRTARILREVARDFAIERGF